MSDWHLEYIQELRNLYNSGNGIGRYSDLYIYRGLVVGRYDKILREIWTRSKMNWLNFFGGLSGR